MDIMIYAIPVFFLLIGIELLIGYFSQQQLYRLGDTVANISCGVGQQVTGVFIKIIGLGSYVYIYEHWRLLSVPNHWASYILLFILIDFFYYWFHRYSHEINSFWGAHVVHHQSEDYNLSVALRQSAFQGVFSTVFYWPLAFLGFDPVPFFIIGTFQTLYQFWIHTEAIRKMPAWFEYVFNTPSHHRAHHGRNPEYIDKNHGGTLILFDRWFGTFEPEKAEVVYGVTKPLATYNPIWANFDYYADLWAAAGQMPRWKDRLRLWVERPGWLPEDMGGQQKVPAVDRQKTEKYNPPLPPFLPIYVLIQYVIILLGATVFLMVESQLDWPKLLALNVVILWALGNLGGLLDLKKWGLPSEYLRLLATPLALYFLFPLGSYIWGLAAWAIISLGLLFYYQWRKANS
ncbi:sterol desaturase [Saprospira grandis DSM 2844]|uniref:Sterol desaturase n=1 Tax=Saprospira grandis DSM 2844 TaxID=694433 RepID=J1I2K6_9BACT|nr:sterol desaturase family protein [Saprospira grandis]EJF52935.1 sterol desaturase [Saprospira grandis DSM 2844]